MKKIILAIIIFTSLGLLIGCQAKEEQYRKVLLKDIYSEEYIPENSSLKEYVGSFNVDFSSNPNFEKASFDIIPLENYTFYSLHNREELVLEDFPDDPIAYKIYMNYILIESNTTYYIYGIRSGKLLSKIEKEHKIIKFNDYYIDVLSYDEDGNFQYDRRYHLKNGEFLDFHGYLSQKNPFGETYQEYTYNLDEDTNVITISKDDKTYFKYQMEGSVNNKIRFNVLKNGNLLITAKMQMSADSETYDYFNPTENKKYAIRNELFILKTKKIKQLPSNYDIDFAYPLDDAKSPNDNLISVSKIDKRTKGRQKIQKFYCDNELNNWGVLEFEYGEIKGSNITRIGKDQYTYKSTNFIYILNSDNKVVKEHSINSRKYLTFIENEHVLYFNKTGNTVTIANVFTNELLYENLIIEYSSPGFSLFRNHDNKLIIYTENRIEERDEENYRILNPGISLLYALDRFFILYHDDEKTYELFREAESLGIYNNTTISIKVVNGYEYENIYHVMIIEKDGITTYSISWSKYNLNIY